MGKLGFGFGRLVCTMTPVSLVILLGPDWTGLCVADVR